MPIKPHNLWTFLINSWGGGTNRKLGVQITLKPKKWVRKLLFSILEAQNVGAQLRTLRIRLLRPWTLAWKKNSDSIALIRYNFSSFMQNFSIIWIFSSSQPKINCKAHCFTSLANVQSADFCRMPKMSRNFMHIFNIYFQSALPIWTDLTDSIYYWHLFPLGIWCANFKNNLKCHLILVVLFLTLLVTSLGGHHPLVNAFGSHLN